jgi:hypothetical protein
MKVNKLFELAVTSALLLTQSPGTALAETIKPEDALVNRIEYTQINDTNPLQEIKSMPDSSKAILVKALRNSRVNLMVNGNPSSGSICLDKQGKENVIAVLHGIIDKTNEGILYGKFQTGEIQQLTPSIRSDKDNSEKHSDFQVIMAMNVFRSIGGSLEGFRELKGIAKTRSDYLKSILPIEPDYFSKIKVNESDKVIRPDCNFAVQTDHSNSINTDATINQHGEIKQDTINNRVLTYAGDSGGAAIALTRDNKPVFTNYVYSVLQENTPDRSNFDSNNDTIVQNRKHVNMTPNQLGDRQKNAITVKIPSRQIETTVELTSDPELEPTNGEDITGTDPRYYGEYETASNVLRKEGEGKVEVLDNNSFGNDIIPGRFTQKDFRTKKPVSPTPIPPTFQR